MWMTEAAKMHYDPCFFRTKEPYYAWLPMPMFWSQDPSVFCPTRWEEDEGQFDEWAYGTNLVSFAGTTNRKATFCVNTGPPGEVDTSDDFISSPYVQFVKFIRQMDKDRKFNKESGWWYLVNFDQKENRGDMVPRTKECFLMLSIMLRSVKYIRGQDGNKGHFESEDFFNPQYLGKGLGPSNERLSVVALTRQVWSDLTKGMNAQNDLGDWNFPDPCSPDKLAVFYAWNHRQSHGVPVPGAANDKDLAGMTGAVSGIYYAPGQKKAGGPFALPSKFVGPNGGPTEAYFDKVPVHISEVINYMDARQMIIEMAKCYADAKSLFDLAFARTQFQEILQEQEILDIFAKSQQNFIYDSTIFEGAPVTSGAGSKRPAGAGGTGNTGYKFKKPDPPPPEEEEEEAPFETPDGDGGFTMDDVTPDDNNYAMVGDEYITKEDGTPYTMEEVAEKFDSGEW